LARKDKKGSIQDLVFIFVSLVVVGISLLIIFKVSDSINSKMQASSEVNDRGKAAFTELNDMYPGVIDNSILLFMIGLCIVALVLAALVRFHPVFFVFYIIIWIIIIYLSGVFSNLYLAYANHADLVSVAERLTFTTNIIGYLPYIIGVIGFILAVVMYKNWQTAQ